MRKSIIFGIALNIAIIAICFGLNFFGFNLPGIIYLFSGIPLYYILTMILPIVLIFPDGGASATVGVLALAVFIQNTVIIVGIHLWWCKRASRATSQ